MASARPRPFLKQRREVTDVERDENATLIRREGEDVRVGQPFEVDVFIERTDVVPGAPERTPDALPRDVRVEQYPGAYDCTSNVGYRSRRSTSEIRFSATCSPTSWGYAAAYDAARRACRSARSLSATSASTEPASWVA